MIKIKKKNSNTMKKNYAFRLKIKAVVSIGKLTIYGIYALLMIQSFISITIQLLLNFRANNDIRCLSYSNGSLKQRAKIYQNKV